MFDFSRIFYGGIRRCYGEIFPILKGFLIYRVSVKLLYSLTSYYTVLLFNTVLQVTIKANNFYDKYSNWTPSAPIHSRQRDTTL